MGSKAGERGNRGEGEQGRGAGEQGSTRAGERRSGEGAGEQGAGELREAARPGLTLPEQGCVRLREAARQHGLAAWAGRRQLHGVEEREGSCCVRGGSRPYRLYGVVSPGLLMPCFTHTTHQHISTPLGGRSQLGAPRRAAKSSSSHKFSDSLGRPFPINTYLLLPLLRPYPPRRPPG